MMKILCLILLLAPTYGFHTFDEELETDEPNRFRVRGVKETSTEGRVYYSFKGIPYAQPPVKDLRLKDPVPVKPWMGIKSTSENPSPCLQINFFQSGDDDIMGSEDCLYLNVFTSKPNVTESPLPVMFFIHGGGFTAGSAMEYGADILMDRDIVLVVVQYRLGSLGFFSTGDAVISGNYGLKDQTLALKWVQDHIHHFGGDKNRVTIFGESAGASSCHYHMMSPYSKGLFHRVILQSGTAQAPWSRSTTHKTIARKVVKHLGCKYVETSKEIQQCLLKADAHSVISSNKLFYVADDFGPFPFLPRADGDYIPDDVDLLMKNGDFASLDIIAGINKDEGAFFTTYFVPRISTKINDNLSTLAPYITFIQEEPESELIGQQLIQYFIGEKEFGVNSTEEIKDMLSVVPFTYPHDLTMMYMLQHNQNRGNDIYLYELDHPSELSYCRLYSVPYETKNWVSHADDLLYMFESGIMTGVSLQDHRDLLLRRKILNFWTNFAATGDPNSDSTECTWKKATVESMHHLSLVPEECDMKINNRYKTQEFMSLLPTRQNKVLNAKKLISQFHDSRVKVEL